MNTARLETDFTVVVKDHPSWCEWFPTREQAVSYARLSLSLVRSPISVLDSQGGLIAEFNAASPAPSRDRSAVDIEASLATPNR